MRHAVRLLLLLPLLAVVAAVGCDKATPTAPSGSTLAISSNPSKIGLTGTSTITIIGRQPNGSAMREGTEIRLASSIGSVEPLVLMNGEGVATATLRADGRKGAATVTAQTGTISGNPGSTGGSGTGNSSGSLSVSTTVQIGEVEGDKPTLLISVSPNTLPVGTGEAKVTVIGRNADGTPVAAGQTVILTTTLGSLSPSRPLTAADGTATSTFKAGNVAGTATIAAVLGTSEEKTTTATIRDAATAISLDAVPRQITVSGGEITISAFVNNSEGLSLQGVQVRFKTTLGTFSSTTDFTDTQGLAEVKLTVTQDQVSRFVGSKFTVTAETPSGNGDIISDDVEISITGR